MEKAVGIGEVSGEMAEQRAKELALITDRPVLTWDYEQAVHELSGEPERDEWEVFLESNSQEEQWDAFADSTGYQVSELTSDGEDQDGRDERAQLFEEGVSEGEHDQMQQAARLEEREQRGGRPKKIPKTLLKDASSPAVLVDLVDYTEGAVVSKKLVKKKAGRITLFAFDKGQGMGKHKVGYDVVVCVLEGVAAITIAGKVRSVSAGEMIIFPARMPHSLQAEERFKMMLTEIHS